MSIGEILAHLGNDVVNFDASLSTTLASLTEETSRTVPVEDAKAAIVQALAPHLPKCKVYHLVNSLGQPPSCAPFATVLQGHSMTLRVPLSRCGGSQGHGGGRCLLRQGSLRGAPVLEVDGHEVSLQPPPPGMQYVDYEVQGLAPGTTHRCRARYGGGGWSAVVSVTTLSGEGGPVRCIKLLPQATLPSILLSWLKKVHCVLVS